MAQRLKCLPAMRETWVQSMGQEDPLEKEMATHSSILAWRIPWTEEPGGLQSTGSQRVRHDRATSLSLSLGCFIDLLIVFIYFLYMQGRTLMGFLSFYMKISLSKLLCLLHPLESRNVRTEGDIGNHILKKLSALTK